jgi:hypothetical protein
VRRVDYLALRERAADPLPSATVALAHFGDPANSEPAVRGFPARYDCVHLQPISSGLNDVGTQFPLLERLYQSAGKREYSPGAREAAQDWSGENPQP